MKKTTVSVICIIIAVLMVLGILGPVAIGGMLPAFASSTTDRLEQNKREQNQLQQKLEQTTEEKRAIMQKKEDLDEEISSLASKIDSINKKIAQNESDIKEKTAQIDELENKIEDSDELLKKRLRVMYEKGNTNYLEILFAATSFSDLLIRMDMVQQLYNHDITLITQLSDSKKSIEDAKARIEEAKSANVSLKAELASEKGTLQAKSDESDATIAKLKKTEADIKEEIAAKERENQNILASISSAKASGIKSENTYTGGILGWPSTQRGTITSRFGWRTLRGVPNNHTGLDIGLPMGTPVIACEDGVVTGSGWRGAYGYCVTIDHGSITTLYAHNSVLQCSVGDRVSKGQQIALVGSTGNSTGPHIHLGVIKNGNYVDPAPYVGL